MPRSPRITRPKRTNKYRRADNRPSWKARQRTAHPVRDVIRSRRRFGKAHATHDLWLDAQTESMNDTCPSCGDISQGWLCDTCISKQGREDAYYDMWWHDCHGCECWWL